MNAGSTSQPRNELTQRIISGLAMAIVALAALWLGGWPFGLFLAVLAGVASWEWGRIVRGVDFDSYFVVHALAVALATVAGTAGATAASLLILLGCAVVLIALGHARRDIFSGIGVVAIGLPALCLARLRSDAPLGLQAVLFLFVVVWMTDIGGYVFGRGLGGPKLWAAISPGKTWAGAIGGLALAGLAGAAMAGWLVNRDIIGAVLAAIMLGLAAEYGDLAESALKRRFGRKDASGLIPGHGGVLDRIDALMAAAVVASLFAILRNPTHPAAGLLLWP